MFSRTLFRAVAAGRAAAARRSLTSTALPPDKMRALISIYHQSQTFVTKENLDAKIDEAFLGIGSFEEPLSYEDLEMMLEARKEESPVTEWYPQERPTAPEDGWSNRAAARDVKVVEALYGIDAFRATEAVLAYPGLESLEDEKVEEKEESTRGYPKGDF